MRYTIWHPRGKRLLKLALSKPSPKSKGNYKGAFLIGSHLLGVEKMSTLAWLQKESKRPEKDRNGIKERMELTYAFRRVYLNEEKRSLKDVMSDSISLFIWQSGGKKLLIIIMSTNTTLTSESLDNYFWKVLLKQPFSKKCYVCP